MDSPDHPRYQSNPILFFFEQYLADVVGELDRKQRRLLESLNIHSTLNIKSKHWRVTIEEQLNLPDTFQIAVLDSWYQWVDSAEIQKQEPEVSKFVKAFADAYLAKVDNIDTWDSAALSAALKRIKEHQKKKIKENEEES